MNIFALLADGVYIGSGFIVVLLIILLLVILFR